jgi:hypothetical protein
VRGGFVCLYPYSLESTPKVERFVKIRKSSRYEYFKHLLDAVEHDLVGERDGVWFFVGKEIDEYQG